MTALALGLVMGLSVWGIFAGIRMYRADAKLPTDLVLALEVGSTRTGAVDDPRRPPGHALRPAGPAPDGPEAGRQVPPQDRPRGQPRRPHHRPLRGPPRGLRLPRRFRRPGVPGEGELPPRRHPVRLRRALDRGRHLVGDPHPQGRHRTDPARLPRRARGGGERWAGLPPGPGPRRLEVRGPLGGRTPHHATADGPRHEPPRRLHGTPATQRQRAGRHVRHGVAAGEELGAPIVDTLVALARTCAARTRRTPAARRPARSPRPP